MSLKQIVMDHLWAQGIRPSPRVPGELSGRDAARWVDERLGIAATPSGRTITIDGRPVSDYLSPDPVLTIPGGEYDCVLGHLARTNPEAAALLPDAAVDTQRDGFWLTHRARQRGLVVFKVKAPKVLQERGIETVNAYPKTLLAERFDG